MQQESHQTIATDSAIQPGQNIKETEAQSQNHLSMLRVTNGNNQNNDTGNCFTDL